MFKKNIFFLGRVGEIEGNIFNQDQTYIVRVVTAIEANYDNTRRAPMSQSSPFFFLRIVYIYSITPCSVSR